jgi:hypothetical protein
MLVSALSNRDNILNAYDMQLKQKYRFFSYGDAMLIENANTEQMTAEYLRHNLQHDMQSIHSKDALHLKSFFRYN